MPPSKGLSQALRQCMTNTTHSLEVTSLHALRSSLLEAEVPALKLSGGAGVIVHSAVVIRGGRAEHGRGGRAEQGAGPGVLPPSPPLERLPAPALELQNRNQNEGAASPTHPPVSGPSAPLTRSQISSTRWLSGSSLRLSYSQNLGEEGRGGKGRGGEVS